MGRCVEVVAQAWPRRRGLVSRARRFRQENRGAELKG